MDNELIRVENLRKTYPVRTASGRKKVLTAVNDVSFSVERGSTLGLVGESGCGKTTLGRTVLRLTEPDSGKIFFRGEDISRPYNMRDMRRRMQIVFQNPAGSLDPMMTVKDIVAEGLDIHKIGSSKREREEMALRLLADVGLTAEHAERRPTAFSGGQQQRVGIARALAVNPEFIVCDEAVSALDLSCQSQIINLLEELREKRSLTYLFISHDVSVVRHISDRIAVMYLGSFTELGTSREIGLNAAHPYTRSLLAAVPIPDPRRSRARERVPISGDALSAPVPERGCLFAPRCPYCEKRCAEEAPPMREISPGHLCACHVV